MKKLQKPIGYRFDSVELGRVTKTDGKELVVAQIDSTHTEQIVRNMVLRYNMSEEDEEILLSIAGNCDGMVHVFSPEQVEVIPQ